MTETSPFENPPDKVAHADLWRGLNYLNQQMQKDREARIVDMIAEQRRADQLDRLFRLVGDERENEEGRIIRTGLLGKIHGLNERMDQRFRFYDMWKERGIGIFMATSVLILVIWWFAKDGLHDVFKVKS